jgi:RNA polymerase sigma-70 factor (ECF subfamily)
MDKGTIERFIAGDEKAFEVLYNEYYKLVFKISYMRVLDYDSTIGLCQDVFLKVFLARDSFNRGNIKYWILQIANNIVSDYLKALIKRKEAEKNYIVEPEKGDDSVFDLARKVLDDKSFEVIYMHYCLNMKFKDIANYYGDTTSKITSIASHSLKKIKKEYEK